MRPLLPSLVLLLALASSASAQIFWHSINGEVDSVAQVARFSKSVAAINKSYTVDSIIDAFQLDPIPYSITVTSHRTALIGTTNGLYRFAGRVGRPTVPLSRQVRRLTSVGPEVYAATDSGLFKSSNDGVDWSLVPFFGEQQVRFVASDGNYVYAATEVSVFRSGDSAATWVTIKTSDTAKGIGFLGVACGQLAIGQTVLYLSRDHGATFLKTPLERVADVLCDDSLTYALDVFGTVYATVSNSFVVQSAVSAANMGVYDPEQRLLAAFSGTFGISTDRGMTWKVPKRSPQGISIAIDDNGAIWAGAPGHAMVTLDAGDTWLPVGPLLRVDTIVHYDTVWKYDTTYSSDTLKTRTLMSGRAVRALLILPDQSLVCATDIGIVRTTDIGQHWQLSNSGLRDSNLVAISRNGTAAYTATASTLYRSTDWGHHWDSLSRGWTNETITSIAAANSYLLVGTNRGAYRTVDDGAHWTGVTAQYPGVAVDGITIAPTGTVFLWMTGAIIRSFDAGSTWSTSVLLDVKFRNVAANGGLVAYAFEQGYVGVSQDDGLTWTQTTFGDNVFLVGVHPSSLLLIEGNLFSAVTSFPNVGMTYQDPWHGFLTDFAYDSSFGYYASIANNGVLYHNDQDAAVRAHAAPELLSALPNPTSGTVTIDAGNAHIASVTVLSQLGVQVVSPSSWTGKLDLTQLPRGTYFLRIVTENGIVLRKVVRE